MNMLIIGIIFVVVFFLGRWSLLLGNQKALKELSYKMAIETMKELSPNELTINLLTMEVEFDKPPINAITVKFTGTQDLIDEILEDDQVDAAVKDIVRTFKNN